jgi:hypothetical protein
MSQVEVFHRMSFHSALTIDCSTSSASEDGEATSMVSEFIGLVKRFPRKEAVHVTLHALRTGEGRTLRSTLQALGCRVTTKLLLAT